MNWGRKAHPASLKYIFQTFSKALLQVANTTIKDKGKNTEREVYNISHEKWLKVSDSIDEGYYKKSKCTQATAPNPFVVKSLR